MDTLKMREAVAADLAAIERIIKDAVARMLSEGKCQWDENYPTAVHILDDISRHNGYVLELDDEVVAYGAVVFDGEPAYRKIEGTWLSDEDYVVVHRLATSQNVQGRGVARSFMQAVEQMAAEKGVRSFRVDTNFDNDRMKHILGKCGFTFCGKIEYEKGSRLAFEKLL